MLAFAHCVHKIWMLEINKLAGSGGGEGSGGNPLPVPVLKYSRSARPNHFIFMGYLSKLR